MDKQSKYTAQEMREMAGHLIDICDTGNECNEYRNTIGSFSLFDCESALRQAADAEEELAKLSESKNRWMRYQETAAGERNACIDELRKKDAEIAQLKARLETKEACRSEHN